MGSELLDVPQRETGEQFRCTQNTKTLCGQNAGFLNVKLVVHVVTTGQ